MTLSSDMIDAARRRLGEEKVAVESELTDLGASPDGSVKVALDEGFADAAQSTSERSKVLSIVDNLQERLAEIESALGRIERGIYGICERCGEPISPERLEAIPSTRFCINHAQRR